MRLALVVPAFPKLSETFIVNKFLGLLDQGYAIEVICSKSTESEWSSFRQFENRHELRRRVHVHWRVQPRWLVAVLVFVRLAQVFRSAPKHTIRYLNRGRKRYKVFDLLRRFYLDAAFIVAKPDIIHFEFGALATDRMYLKDLLGCKIAVSFRGYDMNFSGLEDAEYYQQVWKMADGLHFLGQDLWKRAIVRGCPPEKRHVEIPPSIDVSFFNRSKSKTEVQIGTTERPLRLLSVGRIEWKKGYDFALQAVALLLECNIKAEYRIVGDGDYLEALAFCRHQLGLDDVVIFWGAVPREEVRENMEWADICLHAAVSEGFCNAVLEAQAMQLPVVTSDADGLPENVENGVTGFVVPRRNPKVMAEKALLLCQEPTLRQQMGVAGRARVTRLFDLPTQIESFSAFYKQIHASHEH